MTMATKTCGPGSERRVRVGSAVGGGAAALLQRTAQPRTTRGQRAGTCRLIRASSQSRTQHKPPSLTGSFQRLRFATCSCIAVCQTLLALQQVCMRKAPPFHHVYAILQASCPRAWRWDDASIRHETCSKVKHLLSAKLNQVRECQICNIMLRTCEAPPSAR